MDRLCRAIQEHVAEVMAEWERLVREQPWYSLPSHGRADALPDVICRIVEVALQSASPVDAYRRVIVAASEHGHSRRKQDIPEHLILTEYHLLRQALWHYLLKWYGPSDVMTEAITRIDVVITGATNASMWGYHRPEIEAMGRWEESLERLAKDAPVF